MAQLEQKGYLKDQYMTKIFPDMSWDGMQKLVPGVFGSNLAAELSQDTKVHGQDAF